MQVSSRTLHHGCHQKARLLAFRNWFPAGLTLSPVRLSKLAAFPDVPTLKEATGSGWKMAAWRGVAGPKGMPDEATAKLSAALEKVWKSDEFQEFMKGRGFGLVWKPGAEFATWMEESDAALGTVMKAVGLAK